MKWLSNLKTAHKLALGFGLCLSLAGVIGVASIQRIQQLSTLTTTITGNAMPSLAQIVSVRSSLKSYRMAEYRHIASSTPQQKQDTESDMGMQQTGLEKSLNDYAAQMDNPEEIEHTHALQAAWQAYVALTPQILTASRKNDNKTASTMMLGPTNVAYMQILDNIAWLVKFNNDQALARSTEATNEAKSARACIIGLLALAVILGTIVAISLTRYMTGTIAQLSSRLHTLNTVCIANLGKAVEALAQGDLTVKIETASEPLALQSKDEFGVMAQTFNAMLARVQETIGSFRNAQDSLQGLVRQMQDSATQVNSAAQSLAGASQLIGSATEEIGATMHEVAQASEQSARGADEVARGSVIQASSISEGSELVKQLTGSVHSVARDAETAGQATTKATQVAQAGADSVRETVAGMHAIGRTISESAQVIQTLSDSSQQIGSIVQVIEEIAGQTNLLALNAAIEAARAGEAGRGFAVVADEVRKLAERSQGATEEIGGLIATVQAQTAQAVAAMQGGVREVSSRTEMAERTGETLTQIQSVVTAVAESVASICAAAVEMTASSDEVSRAMTDIAAVVEESSAAAEEMSASAQQVSASVQTVANTTAMQESEVSNLIVSAESLSEISHHLSELVAQFTIEGASTPAAAKTRTHGNSALRLQKVA